MREYSEKQFISREMLHSAGYSQYRINRLAAEGELVMINRRFFENPDFDGEINDFYAVNAYAPKGVICLVSAAIFHRLSQERPLQIDVALPRRSRVPESPEYPQMEFYLFSGDRYSTGVMTIQENGNPYLIYDREKTVCDILFYRNKLGFDIAVEVLKNYLEKPDRDLNRLMKYAENLRCARLLRQYLEIMI